MDLSVDPQDVYRLLVAAGVGGLVGLEREFHDKPAGFRTNMLIAIGAALFTMFSRKMAGDGTADQTRIAAQIVTGVGFLGAGVILRDRLTVYGITTAATIWAVASLGMGIGAGYVGLSLVATAVILVVLMLLDRLEKAIDSLRRAHHYTIMFESSEAAAAEVDMILNQAGLRIRSTRSHKAGELTTLDLQVVGNRRGHSAASQQLMASPHVKSVSIV